VPEALADPQRIIRIGGNGAGYAVKLLVNLLWFGQA
jgi:3-hydroxyisobutyrate dehydrogenase